jgi:hypothetical protein
MYRSKASLYLFFCAEITETPASDCRGLWSSSGVSLRSYLRELNAKSQAPELNLLLTPFMFDDPRPTLLSHSHGMK